MLHDNNMSCVVLIWGFTISACISIHISTVGPSSLPRGINGHAIAYDKTTNLIWVIGGLNQLGNSLISFNLSIWNYTNAFFDHGYPLSYSVFSASQAYVQMQSVVYVVQYPWSGKLMVYDIMTENVNQVGTNLFSVQIWYDACLASIEDWIIYTYANETYILTISTCVYS